MSGDSVAKRDTTPLIRRDPLGLAHHFANSGYFNDARKVSQAVVKTVFGEELGIGIGASMQGIHIIEGKPSLGANLLGTLVKRSERYDYKPQEITDKLAKIEFFVDGESAGFSEFTIEQAQRAGLVRDKSGWVKYPEAMLFARALSQGVRWFCPDITAGTPAYTPEELGAEVDESGEPVFVESVVEADAGAGTPTELDSEKLAELIKGIEIVKPALEEEGVNWLDGMNLILGSIGVDAFNPNDAVEDQLRSLSSEQADGLDEQLKALADPEEVDGEVVGEAASADA